MFPVSSGGKGGSGAVRCGAREISGVSPSRSGRGPKDSQAGQASGRSLVCRCVSWGSMQKPGRGRCPLDEAQS